MNQIDTPTRAYSKSELAQAYSPELTQCAALNRLRRWIEGDRDLLAALHAAGYRPQQRILTAKQVAIIYEFIGEPL